jgi:DNA-dependent RNA polymerase auxiliary subunit epsilon
METWKDIKGYEGLYQVSNHGNVRSFYRGCNNLVPKKNNKGYLWIELTRERKRKQFLVHRLVAVHFIENIQGLPIINHKDENKENNHVENLEWCSLSYNVLYSLYNRDPLAVRKTKKWVPSNRQRNIRKIDQFDLQDNLVKTWDSFINIKYELSKNESSVRDCCN